MTDNNRAGSAYPHPSILKFIDLRESWRDSLTRQIEGVGVLILGYFVWSLTWLHAQKCDDVVYSLCWESWCDSIRSWTRGSPLLQSVLGAAGTEADPLENGWFGQMIKTGTWVLSRWLKPYSTERSSFGTAYMPPGFYAGPRQLTGSKILLTFKGFCRAKGKGFFFLKGVSHLFPGSSKVRF